MCPNHLTYKFFVVSINAVSYCVRHFFEYYVVLTVVGVIQFLACSLMCHVFEIVFLSAVLEKVVYLLLISTDMLW